MSLRLHPFSLAFPLLPTLPSAAHAENRVNAYGCDSGGQNHETLARTTLEKAAALGGKEGANLAAAAFTQGDAVHPAPPPP